MPTSNVITSLARTPVLDSAGCMVWQWLRNLSTTLQAANNLSDLQSIPAALANLGFTGGTSHTVPLAKITGSGTNGSMVLHTWSNGLTTVGTVVDPT